MSHRFWADWSNSDPFIADPGTGKALPTSRSGYIPIVTGASGETNTLADPDRVGLELTIHLLVDGGGDRVITAATAILGNLGSTTITLADAGDTLVLRAVGDGTTARRWMLVAATGLPTAEAASEIGIADAGGYTTTTNVEAALAELYQHLFGAGFATVDLPLNTWREVDADGDVGNNAANGGVLSSETTPVLEGSGTTYANRLLWATGNVDTISSTITLPLDFDGTADALLQMVVASAGTTNGFDAAVIITNWDGGIDITDAATDTAAVNIHAAPATIAAADIPNNPLSVTVSITPPTHATDILYFYGARLRYKRAIQSS